MRSRIQDFAAFVALNVSKHTTLISSARIKYRVSRYTLTKNFNFVHDDPYAPSRGGRKRPKILKYDSRSMYFLLILKIYDTNVFANVVTLPTAEVSSNFSFRNKRSWNVNG